MLGKEYILIEDKNNVVDGFLYDSTVKVVGFTKFLNQDSCYIEYKSENGDLIENGLVFKRNLKEVE